MRTEVKIGLAAAAFIAIVVVVYFMLSSPGADDVRAPEAANEETPTAPKIEPEEPQDEIASEEPESEDRTYVYGSGPDDRSPGRLNGLDLPERREPAPAEAPTGSSERPVRGMPLEEVAVREPEPLTGAPLTEAPEEPSEMPTTDVEPDDSGLTIPYAGTPLVYGIPDRTPPAREREPVETRSPVVPSVSPERTEARTYTVTEGDQGFWGISEKVYGSGKHFQRIAEANPGVDPRRLRVGQTLTIPALTARAVPSARGGGEGRPPIGGEMGRYVVKEGDKGFWGVAKAVYGDGTLWQAIRQANPDIEPTRLRVGQTVLYPPRSAARGAGTARRAAAGAVEYEDGARKYVVRQGDTGGFWAIAKEVYGDGVYYPVIEEANPDVDPRKLRPGQKINVPELSSAVKARYRETARGSAAREPVALPAAEDGFPRPRFD